MPQIINDNPGIGALLGTGLGQGFSQGLNQIAGLKIQQLLESHKQTIKLPQQQAFAKAIQDIVNGESQAQQPQDMQGQQIQGAEASPAQNTQGNINIPPVNEKQAIDLANLSQKVKKSKQEEHKTNIDFNKDIIKSVRDKGRAAKELIPVLKRGIKLSESGEIRNPYIAFALDKLGINSEAFMNGDTNELQKLSNYILRGASKTFGGKVSNFETQQLLKGFINQFQSNEGRIQLAGQLLKTAELEAKEYEVFRDIVKKNGSKVPFDLEDKLEEKMKPYYEKYQKEFINAPSSKSTTFSALADADASKYKGKRIVDEDTGTIYISKDGKWVKE